MGDYLVSEYEQAGKALPAGLLVALDRDTRQSGAEYLAASASASDAGQVLGYLREILDRVPVSQLVETVLEVVAESETEAELIGQLGAKAVPAIAPSRSAEDEDEFGILEGEDEPAIQTASFQTSNLDATTTSTYTPLLNGQPFGADVNGVFEPLCSIGLNGYWQGGWRFLTIGECVSRAPGPFFVADVATAGQTAATKGIQLSAVQSGPGLSEPDGPAFIGVPLPLIPEPTTVVWNNGQGAIAAGTPVPVRDVVPPVVGATICKSSLQTGWRCGKILEVTNGMAGESFTPYERFVTDLCAVRGELGSPGLVGNAAVGILAASSWSESCDPTDQGTTQPYSSFLSLVSASGRPSIRSENPEWEPMIDLLPVRVTHFPGEERGTTSDGNLWTRFSGYVDGANAGTTLQIELDDGPTFPIQIRSGGYWYFNLPVGYYDNGIHEYDIRTKWGRWNWGPSSEGTYEAD